MWTWWVSRSSRAPVRRSAPNTDVYSSKGRLLVTMVEPRSYPLGEHLKQQLGAGLRQRHVAELVDDQQLVGDQLALETQQALLVAGFHELMHDGRGGREADRQSLLAGGETEPQRNVALAGAALAERT